MENEIFFVVISFTAFNIPFTRVKNVSIFQKYDPRKTGRCKALLSHYYIVS